MAGATRRGARVITRPQWAVSTAVLTESHKWHYVMFADDAQGKGGGGGGGGG
eukprot:COSAG01_NODE_4697_length_4806_cov_2.403654_1_plen_51_part_10